ncbi:MAG: hypothetical protein GY798_20120 [Hyphomicrobiales bacterium]|nr:hypothetical protein [Hyphomicrobiales bacterium]
MRKVFRVWDPAPHLDLDFFWEGRHEDSDRGAVGGEGRLIWLTKGAAAYDRNAIYSEYRGEMADGRPDGVGTLTFRSGREFEGTWISGDMTGHGILRYENGDEYTGGFRANKPDGLGRYAAVDGTRFEGRFIDGERHGPGILITPNGERWHSIWQDGKEIQRTLEDSEAIELAQRSGLEVSVYSDRKKNKKFKRGGRDDGFSRFVYSASNDDGHCHHQARL